MCICIYIIMHICIFMADVDGSKPTKFSLDLDPLYMYIYVYMYMYIHINMYVYI